MVISAGTKRIKYCICFVILLSNTQIKNIYIIYWKIILTLEFMVTPSWVLNRLQDVLCDPTINDHMNLVQVINPSLFTCPGTESHRSLLFLTSLACEGFRILYSAVWFSPSTKILPQSLVESGKCPLSVIFVRLITLITELYSCRNVCYSIT